MKLWNFYFIAKLFLYFGHYIGFHVPENLAFALLLLAPLKRRGLAIARQVLAVPAAAALFYYDTWLPPFERLIAQSSMVQGFSFGYLIELAGRFINLPVIAALAAVFVAYLLASRKRQLTPAVFAVMLVPLLPIDDMLSRGGQESASVGPFGNAQASATVKEPALPATDANLKASLDAFFGEQAKHVVSYGPPQKTDAPFDIIFLQICSLSWDDLKFVKEVENPFFKRFDIIFTDFNSATAYSGPAMIRINRGSCGQERHVDLYDPDPAECHTLHTLKRIGFEPQVALNHDGTYGGFNEELRELAGVTEKPLDLKGLAPHLYSFDDSPIYDDYAVLNKWWNKRLETPSQRMVLYYNTITMHDGARYADGSVTGDSLKTYRPRLTKLFADLDRFFAQVAASGRRAVVVFIPEHGASLRGDKMQIAGMREIPSPTISIVPVGIKLIGMPERNSAGPLVVSQPSSYLAVSTILRNFIGQSPFEGKSGLESYVKDLPTTDFVAENNSDTLVMRYGSRYFMLAKKTKWSRYDPTE